MQRSVTGSSGPNQRQASGMQADGGTASVALPAAPAQRTPDQLARRDYAGALTSRLATTSEMSSTGTALPVPVTPSVIIVMQNGQATAI